MNTLTRPVVRVPKSTSKENLDEVCRQIEQALIEVGAPVYRDLYGRLVTVRKIKQPATMPYRHWSDHQ